MDNTTEASKEDLTIIILAAGKGKRMNNPETPKVMALMDGVPLIGRVLLQALRLNPRQIIVVVGHHKELVADYAAREFGDAIEFAVQEAQLGTGHAALQAVPLVKSKNGDVLILSGDTPLLQAETMRDFVSKHRSCRPVAAVSTLSMILDKPAGYGRIVRSPDGEFLRIVESKDASPEEAAIHEVNSGVYIVNSQLLSANLRELSNSNAQKEFYLTDIIEILRKKNFFRNAIPARDADELRGINTPDELDQAVKIYRDKFAPAV